MVVKIIITDEINKIMKKIFPAASPLKIAKAKQDDQLHLMAKPNEKKSH